MTLVGTISVLVEAFVESRGLNYWELKVFSKTTRKFPRRLDFFTFCFVDFDLLILIC